MNKQNILLSIVVLTSIILFRWLNIPNFNPTLALTIICGAFVSNRLLAFSIPMIALFICDLSLGLTKDDPSFMNYITSGDFLLNYTFYFLAIYAGKLISNKLTLSNSILATILSALIFFVGSNFITWATTSLYAKTADGLMLCYTSAIPFIGATMVSNLVSIVVFYIAFSYMTQKKVQLV